MPHYKVNRSAVKQARKLIDSGHVDTETSWSEAAPSTPDRSEVIEEQSFREFADWHLAVDPDATPGTKGSVAFPYGDFESVNRAALIHAKQRASQNGHDEIEKAADQLLQHLDRRQT